MGEGGARRAKWVGVRGEGGLLKLIPPAGERVRIMNAVLGYIL